MKRPRKFDLDEASDRSLKVFSRTSYEWTTSPNPTKAIGIDRSNVYAALELRNRRFARRSIVMPPHAPQQLRCELAQVKAEPGSVRACQSGDSRS
jgi:hypothetical protein